MSKMSKTLTSPQIIYDIVEEYYPGLIIIRDNRLYMCDTSISSDLLAYKMISNSIRLRGVDFSLTLYGDTLRPDNTFTAHNGHFCMDYDLELSDESCITLYNHDLMIYYNDINLERVIYDKVSIMRRHTIKNILS